MKISAIRKHYPTLTASERFRMAIAALARKDNDDLALLRTTCPMKTYEATDEAFQGQWEQSARVVRLFAMMWFTNLIWLREAEVNRVYAHTARDYFREGYVMGANAAWEEAYLTAEDFARYGTRHAGEPDKWEEAYIARCAGMKTAWAGFERFCKAVDFTPDTLLGWWSAGKEHIENARAVLDGDLPIDEGAANEMCRMYLWLWNQREMVVGEVEL